MIRYRSTLALLFFCAFLVVNAHAQSSSPAAATSEASELLSLSKKIDAQNIKIDLLSQQILRLQQEIEHPKAMTTGEAAPRALEAAPVPTGGNTHLVAKGETLTSIARMHKVSIEELQKLNHIENDRKLQIGQTLVIPGAAGAAAAAAASPSPSATAPNE